MVEASAVGVVDRLLREALAQGASDLHLDPLEDGVAVVLRRDGVPGRVETLPRELGPRLVGRLKALADLLAYRSDVPQEGRIPAERSGVGREFRVATYPTLLGERVAVRLDAPEGAPQAIEALGLPDDVEETLRSALAQPDGVILLTGPSGSGKTTTLYACLRHVVGQPVPRSVVTVEDPIERRVPGVTQTVVNPAAGLTYARALRSLLRQDPDVLLVGEIRDAETASVVLEAGLTGHLVASTLHAGTPAQVLLRLLEMGMEPFALAASVRGVLAQRLLRRRRPDGQGYEGRVLVAEWAPMTPRLRQAVLAREEGEGLEEAVAGAAHRSLREQADALVAQGLTTDEEVDRVLGTR